MSALPTTELRKVVEMHPRFRERLLPNEVEESVPAEVCREYYEAINEAIELENSDKLRCGWEPEMWRKADEELRKFREENPVGVLIFVVLGGIRSSKTEWRSKRTVEAMLTRRDYKVWASHSTQESSREAQQSKIHDYVPNEYKSEKGRLRIGSQLKVNYTPWSGFTENTFAFPSNLGGVSECRFKFYSMDPRSLEGAEIDEGWLDEQAGMEWLNAYIGRCATRNGIVFLTFAAIDGYTPLVKAILDGAKTLETTDAKMLPIFRPIKSGEGDFELGKQESRKTELGPKPPPGHEFVGYEKVPRVQENLNMQIASGEDSGMRLKGKARIIYFHTSDNPYGNPESLAATLDGASPEKIKMMFYGVPTRAIASQFNYVDAIHTMKLTEYAALVERLGNRGPRYMIVDPCSGRNWFMIWLWFWAPQCAIVYREWPSFGHPGAFIEGIGDPGPWAVPGKSPDGDRGEAQRPFRFGLERYAEVIQKAEAATGERITHRLMDCRYANSPTQDREGTTTLIQQLAELPDPLDFIAMKGEKKILSGEADGSVEMINRALAYDEKVPIGEFSPGFARINEPRLRVLETCPNTKFALETWTAKDGAHGACKDPIDCVRGAYLTELDYVDANMMRPKVHAHFQRR